MRIFLFFLSAAFFVGGPVAFTQTDKALLGELARENKKSVEALALYPEDARLAILEASKYPEVLVKMQNMHEKTSAAFRTLIEDFPRSTQTVFFDLTRYPGLVAGLVARRDNPVALRQALEVLPDNSREEAYGVVERQMYTLVKMNDLNGTAQGAFESMTGGYPEPARNAFRKLLELPEVVDILNEDLRFTVLVGDVYREDPTWVIQKMDSLSLTVARAHAEELDAWKKTVESDPEAREELQAAAREYSDEYGYTDEVYDIIQADDLYAEPVAEAAPAVVERHYYYNYSYWFGYPWWAPQPCWRPYPYWWYWGFYPYDRAIIIVHLPSYHFMNWYFYHPHHHHVYNHLSTHFVNHYYAHRNSGTTITTGVGEWRNHNRAILSDEWLTDKSRLPERLREYGRFEQRRQTFNQKNPGRSMGSTEYLEKNARQYPELVRSRAQANTEIQRERTDEDRQRSNWAPEKAPAPADRSKTQPTPPTRTEPAEPAPRPERPARQPAKKPSIDEAKDYHRERWQTPERPAAQPKPARAPQAKPATPAPRKEPPKTKPAEKQQPAPKARKEREG